MSDSAKRMKPIFVIALLFAGAVSAQNPIKSPAKPNPECDEGSGGSDGMRTFACVKGRWKDTTEDTWKEFEKINTHRDRLYFALRSRILTKEEMAEVIAMDWHITEHLSVGLVMQGPDYETQKRRQFNDALLQQFKLQQMSAERIDCEN